jgi:hypothetical protein
MLVKIMLKIGLLRIRHDERTNIYMKAIVDIYKVQEKELEKLSLNNGCNI